MTGLLQQEHRSHAKAATTSSYIRVCGASGSKNKGRKIVEINPATIDHGDPHEKGDQKHLKQILGTVLRQQHLSKIKIEHWNGEPVMESSAAIPLLAIGAERDNRSLVLWPSQLGV